MRNIGSLLATIVVAGCTSSSTSADAAADLGVDLPFDRSSPPASEDAWPCPAEWVRAAAGGCGPAVLLCAPDGGAARGACDGVDIEHSHAIVDADGDAGTSFYRLPDGGIGGGWSLRAWPCPAGWRARPEGACDANLRDDCPAGSAPLPGGSCTPTALRDCAEGEYAAEPPEVGDAQVVWVRAGAPSGDGRADHPYATLAEGVRGAGDGGWVFVAEGDYPESLVLHQSVHIIGRCAARVRVNAARADTSAIEVVGEGVRADLRGLTLTGRRFGAFVHDGAALTLRATAVLNSGHDGVYADGASTRLTLDGVRIADTSVRDDGVGGLGVRIESIAGATITQTAVERSHEHGVSLGGRSGPIVLEDSLVRQTIPLVPRISGGVSHFGEGELRIVRTVVDDNPTWSVDARAPGARLSLEDCVLSRNTLGDPTAQHGGLGAHEGAVVTATRVRLSDNLEVGAQARRGDSTMSLTDVWIERTHAKKMGDQSNGISANALSVIRARRVVVTGCEWFGAVANTEANELSSPGVLEISDSLVVGTRLTSDGLWGGGVAAYLGGVVHARRVLVLDSREFGVGASALGSLDLEDVIVEGTTPSRRGFGVGVGTSAGASLRFERLSVDRVSGAGLISDQHTEDLGVPLRAARVLGSDLFVRNVSASPTVFNPAAPGAPGSLAVSYGVATGSNTSLDISRLVIAGGGYGLALFGPTALSDGVITDQDHAGFRNALVYPSPPDFERVRFVGNRSNEFQIDNSLPEGRLPISRD